MNTSPFYLFISDAILIYTIGTDKLKFVYKFSATTLKMLENNELSLNV